MTDSITTLTIYPQIVNYMIGLFKDECDLSRMTEQDVVSELEDIVEVFNEDSYEQVVEQTDWCKMSRTILIWKKSIGAVVFLKDT